MDEDIRILCVDDEKNVLKSLERVFIDSDFEIITTMSGEEGLAALESPEPIQVVMSDYRMPKMNGVEFLKEVCRIRPGTIRIVLSGYADTAAIVEAINEGQIYRFIPKPWNDDELKVSISNALERYFLNKENIKLTEELCETNEELVTLNRNLEELADKRTGELKFQNEVLKKAQNVLDSLPFAVIGMDSEGTIVQCNKIGADLLNQDDWNIMGLSGSDIFPDNFNDFIENAGYDSAICGTIPGNDIEVQLKKAQMKYSNGQEGLILVLEEIKENDRERG